MSDSTDLINDDPCDDDDCQERPCPKRIIKSWHKKEKKKDKEDGEVEDKHQKRVSDICMKYSEDAKKACHEFNAALDEAMRDYYKKV